MEQEAAPRRAGRAIRGQVAFLGAGVLLLVACATRTEVEVAPSTVPTATPYAALPAATVVAKAPPPTPPPVFTPPPSPTPEIERVTYQLAAGDNPSSVAAKFSVTLAELLKANNITNASSLQIGQVLVIPVTPTPGVTAAGPTPTASPRAGGTPSGTATPGAPRASETQTYTVKSGDNASTIAGSFGTTVAELARLNGTSEAALRNLQIGQQLHVPAAPVTTPTAAATGTPAAGATATPGAAGSPTATATATATATSGVPAGSDVYIVKAGDTAIDIASLFGISVARLAAANNVGEADLRTLQIGQRLVIPGS